MSLIEFPLRETAAQLRRRLLKPLNGRISTELDIVSPAVARRFKAEQDRESRRIERALADAEYVEKCRRVAMAHLAAIEAARAAFLANRIELQGDRAPVRPTINLIAKIVGEKYGVSELDIRSHRRTAPLVLPRHIAMYLARYLTELSFPLIGRNLGNRDHTSVLYAVEKIAQIIRSDAVFALEIDGLKQQIMERI